MDHLQGHKRMFSIIKMETSFNADEIIATGILEKISQELIWIQFHGHNEK